MLAGKTQCLKNKDIRNISPTEERSPSEARKNDECNQGRLSDLDTRDEVQGARDKNLKTDGCVGSVWGLSLRRKRSKEKEMKGEDGRWSVCYRKVEINVCWYERQRTPHILLNTHKYTHMHEQSKYTEIHTYTHSVTSLIFPPLILQSIHLLPHAASSLFNTQCQDSRTSQAIPELKQHKSSLDPSFQYICL